MKKPWRKLKIQPQSELNHPGQVRLRRDEAEQGTADLIARRGKSRMIERVVELRRKSQVQNFC
jgi:hypothetical protein